VIHNDPPIASDTPLQNDLNRQLPQTDSRINKKENHFWLKVNGPINGAEVLRRVTSKKRTSKPFGYSEEQLQVSLANYLDQRELETKAFKWFHVPNGGKRGILTATKLEAQGVKRGVPDVCILLSGGKVMFVELKTEVGTLTSDQKQFGQDITSLGHFYHVVKGSHPIDVVQKVSAILRDNGVVV